MKDKSQTTEDAARQVSAGLALSTAQRDGRRDNAKDTSDHSRYLSDEDACGGERGRLQPTRLCPMSRVPSSVSRTQTSEAREDHHSNCHASCALHLAGRVFLIAVAPAARVGGGAWHGAREEAAGQADMACFARDTH